MNQQVIGFSIVICTYNGENRLRETFTHLAALKMPAGYEVELILVNNASTDNTATAAQEIWQELGSPFALLVFNEKRPGKGYAVETGYDAARYSYILTADDDNWLQADYLVNAQQLFQQDSTIGVLQGQNTGAFETTPPVWFEDLKHYFVIGGPTEKLGYFPKNDFFVWGAGMVIRKEDWLYLRQAGYAALTSKLPGKAAGEDNELAIALLLLGRKIYYSDQLQYQHFMPAERVQWTRLKQNFETFGYVGYYLFLYGLVINGYQKQQEPTPAFIGTAFRRYWLKQLRPYTWKHHVAYWLMPKEERYQLHLVHYYSLYKWYHRLHRHAQRDIQFLQHWMKSLLEKNPAGFEWPL